MAEKQHINVYDDPKDKLRDDIESIKLSIGTLERLCKIHECGMNCSIAHAKQLRQSLRDKRKVISELQCELLSKELTFDLDLGV